MKNKLIVIVGPNASGKSELAVKIAKDVNGEVVSADSRQVYRGLDIASGKITKKEMAGIRHHLLDVASPRSIFTVTRYRKLALATINDILKRGKMPIICGGTGFYVQAVVDGIVIPEVKPDWKLRQKLEKISADKLFEMLKRIDPARAQTIEAKNPRRLIRAIEIVKTTKKPVPEIRKEPLPYKIMMLGVKRSDIELHNLIAKRTANRLKLGMVAETSRLRSSGLSWKKIESFGLEYRAVAKFLQKKLTRAEMIAAIIKEDRQYAKRQMVWFKRDGRIRWISDSRKAVAMSKKFTTR
ncbi:MAG: tRNA (adenosine(37)-N6)-dimethylallyltransferase MiaA [Candidatus Pacebacteria bacterium]|jgi:tRNA dimethylallyltransferase|nr:tRNA (adenosine(37)-N6)-dimethylallyltransferase MiaA [Candidatus Paceibacterota bacterium]